ncbi:binding protein isoform X5 [Carex rostrata]
MAEQQLRELGEKLQSPPSSKDELVELLKKTASSLSEIEQSPRPSVLDSLNDCFDAFSKPELLKHEDSDAKVIIATCICEITRITAPEAPYSDDVLRDMFEIIVGTFSGLKDSNSATFPRRVAILETLARYRSCVVMLDLDCNDLINEMFHNFFSVVSDDHSQSVVSAMQTIMVVIIEESEEIQENLLLTILSSLGRKKPGFSLAARRLAKSVIENCLEKLESPIKQFLVSSISGEGAFLSNTIDHHEVIFDLYQSGPQILTGIVPFITGELLTDKLEVRSKAVELIGELISLPGVPILESFQPLFLEFLKRLTDRVVDLRISVIEHLKNCLISHPSRPEASQIIQALCDRLLDFDDNVRKKVVAAICDVAHHKFEEIQAETIELVAKRLRDTSISVKKYTMKRLADIYRLYCEKSTDSSKDGKEFEWIPGKILKCLYDKDFRPETIELIMIDYFPGEFSIKDRAKHWVRAFSGFDKIETKALEQILIQKQRLQQEVQKYLALRQTSQEEAHDLQKRISVCFRSMSRLFHDHSKAEESLNALNQLKDANVWKLLSTLLDPATPFQQACSIRAELLKIIDEKHPLHEFMSMLSARCSYLLINKEHVKEFLSVASEEKSAGNIDLLSACMNLLTVIASFFPMLFSGSEEALVNLIKEDDEILKEGIAHVLAKAGGTIRDELATTSSSSIDLILERLCLEGSRKQAKYSVHALAAVTKDDGLKSLSVLYKRIVDTLEEKVHLPSALQSLGCIAQIAMPIFETREEEIVGFLNSKILENSIKADEVSPSKSEWSERSELCSLKIYGLKTLVNSYLPSTDAHAREGIEKLLRLLKNILSYGDVSPNMISSAIDKAHLRLASAKAVLRLSRQWDAQIPSDVYYLTLRISQDGNPQSRKLFLGKVHQYIKERVLDAKYACSFLLNISKYHSPEYEECKHNLLEVVQICQQVKMRQLSVQADMNLLVAYPEYILAYLVHALAHDPSCPKFKEGTEIDAFGPIYWRLSLFLTVLLAGDENTQGVSAANKESYKTVVSILHSIKSSQDIIDADKTQSLHAISDLGLLIAKRLVSDGTEIGQTQAVPLPTQLYTTPEKSEQENGMENKHTWSAAESVMAHFEALKVEEELIDDESLLPVTDKDGNELPLSKILKIIKAQGAKRKKASKKEEKPKDPFEFDGEDEILGVVREINSDNTGGARKKELVSKKRQIEKGSASLTPKKKRSIPVYQSPPKKTEEKKSFKTEKDVSMGENKSSASTSFEGKNKSVDARSSNGSVNKRKRESFLGLEKCSTKGNEDDPKELIGKRIKVWWPLDKKYYSGIVGSYDAGKKKYTILYDDGDKEVLNLAKQQWKLLSSDSLAKRQKTDQKTTPKESLEKKRDTAKQTDSIPQKTPAKKSPSSKKKDSGKPKGRPKKTPSGSVTKDSIPDAPVDTTEADIDDANNGGNKVEKVEEPDAGSKENSEDGVSQSDDEDEPLSTWKANLTKVK